MKVLRFNGILKNKGKVASKRALVKKKLIELMTIAIKLFKVSDKLPTICIFGADNLNLVTPTNEDYEEERLDCRCHSSDANLEEVLIKDRPNVIITIGNLSSFSNLTRAPFEQHLSNEKGNNYKKEKSQTLISKSV